MEDNLAHFRCQNDLFTTLNDGKYFTKLDLSDLHLQVPVHKELRDLLIINTQRGLYRYNRMPFGLKTAPVAFQQIM